MAGNAAGEGMGDSSLSTAQLIAREVIQNFNDAADELRAHDPSHRPRIAFKFVHAQGDEKSKIVEALGLRDLRDGHAPAIRTDRLFEGWQDTTCLRTLDQPDVPLPVLYVEERGTIGLRGNPILQSGSSRWYMCLMSVAASFHDDREGPLGGTYGFGKAAFQLGSRISCVMAYSQFSTTATDSATRRFGGYFYLPRHLAGDLDCSGRAEFGHEAEYPGIDGKVIKPLEDGEADSAAAALGMSRSSAPGPHELGTTFMLPDTPVDPDDLLQAIELFWWPALESHFFEVEVVDFTGNRRVPRPKSRDDLMPYLTAWDMITNGHAAGASDAALEETTKALVQAFPAFRLNDSKTSTGTLALFADLDRAFNDTYEASEIALVRQRKMVVEYASLFANRPPFVQGVLLSHESVEKFVAAAEPKQHDRWWLRPTDRSSGERVLGRWSAETQNVIQELYDRTYKVVGDFRRSLKPPRSTTETNLRRLSERLADLLSYRRPVQGRGKRPPAGGQGIGLEVAGGATEWHVDHGMRGRQPVKVRATDRGLIGARVTLEVGFFIREDEGEVGERMPTSYIDMPQGAKVSDGSVEFVLTREAQTITAVSDWQAQPVSWQAMVTARSVG